MAIQNNQYGASLVTVGSYNAALDRFYFLSSGAGTIAATVVYYDQYSQQVGLSTTLTIDPTTPIQLAPRDGAAYVCLIFGSDIRFTTINPGIEDKAALVSDFGTNKARYPGLLATSYGRYFGNTPGGLN